MSDYFTMALGTQSHLTHDGNKHLHEEVSRYAARFWIQKIFLEHPVTSFNSNSSRHFLLFFRNIVPLIFQRQFFWISKNFIFCTPCHDISAYRSILHPRTYTISLVEQRVVSVCYLKTARRSCDCYCVGLLWHIAFWQTVWTALFYVLREYLKKVMLLLLGKVTVTQYLLTDSLYCIVFCDTWRPLNCHVTVTL